MTAYKKLCPACRRYHRGDDQRCEVCITRRKHGPIKSPSINTARFLTRRAITNGDIVKPTSCVICPSTSYVQIFRTGPAAHEFVGLCRSCGARVIHSHKLVADKIDFQGFLQQCLAAVSSRDAEPVEGVEV